MALTRQGTWLMLLFDCTSVRILFYSRGVEPVNQAGREAEEDESRSGDSAPLPHRRSGAQLPDGSLNFAGQLPGGLPE